MQNLKTKKKFLKKVTLLFFSHFFEKNGFLKLSVSRKMSRILIDLEDVTERHQLIFISFEEDVTERPKEIKSDRKKTGLRTP